MSISLGLRYSVCVSRLNPYGTDVPNYNAILFVDATNQGIGTHTGGDVGRLS